MNQTFAYSSALHILSRGAHGSGPRHSVHRCPGCCTEPGRSRIPASQQIDPDPITQLSRNRRRLGNSSHRPRDRRRQRVPPPLPLLGVRSRRRDGAVEGQGGPGDRSLGGDRSGGGPGSGPAGHEGRRLRQECRQDRGGWALLRLMEMRAVCRLLDSQHYYRLTLAAQLQAGAAASTVATPGRSWHAAPGCGAL